MKKTLFLKTFALLIGLLFQVTTGWSQLLVENFDYPIGSLLTANGWTAHSGAGSQAIDVTTGLNFTGYAGSGIGGAANLDNNGEDVNKAFAEQTTGTVYAAFVIQTQSSNSLGYFLHFGQTTIGSTFITRVYVNATGNGLALSGSTAPTVFAPITAGVPTFIVIKFDFATKISSLFVFNTFPTAEPATANSTFTETATFSNLGVIALRQYNAAQRQIVDGIRIATNWADAATPSGGQPVVETPTFTPTPGVCEGPVSVTLSCATPNSSIYYTTNGTDPDQTSTHFTIPINITQTTSIKARAYADGYDPSSITTGIYTFRTIVSTIAELHAGTPGVPYLLTGEVYLTYKQSWRNQKFVQDYTGAMLIDDFSGIITSDYEIGDGFAGLKGSFTIYQGMLEFVPAFDPGDATGGHLFTPEVITITQLNENFETYESELVKIEDVTFTAGGTTFNGVTPTPYEITDASADAVGNFRTSFLDANYLGTTIPIGPTTIIGICNRAGTTTIGNYITSRTLADIIPSVQTPTIIVTSPNGGEYWQQGSTENITWNNLNFTGNVTIELFWATFTTTLATDIANTGTWPWSITAGTAIGSAYKIRVKGASTGTPSDVSDGNFTIMAYVGAPKIVINEIMYDPSNAQGFDSNFEWLELYNNSGFPVDISGWKLTTAIDYTFAAGATLQTNSYLVVALKPDSIIDFYGITNVVGPFLGALNNTGELIKLIDGSLNIIDTVRYSASAPWPTQPNGFGPSLELIDPSLDNTLPQSWAASLATNGTPGAQNSVFGFQSLTVTSPNGSESWFQGSTHEITWTSVNFAGTIKIELDNGAKALATLAENVDASLGTWSWAIPAGQAVDSAYKIKISDQADGNPMDESNAVFSVTEFILPAIMVTVPNGGEVWQRGTSENITWTNTNFTGNVTILLSGNEEVIILVANIENTGTWAWSIPANQFVGSDYKVTVKGVNVGEPSDESNGAFSIITPPPASVTVTSPNGGESWQQGSTHAITWTSMNFTGNLKIELDNGAKGLTLLAENIIPSLVTWSWVIPADQAVGTSYKIKISEQLTGIPSDESDAVFAIIAVQPLPKIVFSEINYNPPESGTDSTEFIEIYNNDVMSVNLEGWKISLGVVFTFPSYELAPGAYCVIAFNDTAVKNTFGIMPLQWTSGGLSNSGEPIEIRNASNEVIDYVSFTNSSPWPTAANGSGPSLTLCDPSSDNSLAANWTPCADFVKLNTAGAAIYASPGFGCTGVAQTYTLPIGWSGISSYIAPANPDVVNMFAPVINSLVILQDFSNLYMPLYGINTIGNWDTKTGYQYKLGVAKYFAIKGAYETNKTVNLSEGWNGLPVISKCPVSVATLFGGVPEVIFIKEMGSSLVYWPDGGMTSLITLVPGRAYYIKVSSAINVTFPECAAKGNFETENTVNKVSSIWNDVAVTGASHAVGFTASALHNLKTGDVIGTFTSNGLCAGITEVGDGNALIMAWANDVYTLEADGFTETEALTYKVYRPSTGEVFDVTAVYDNTAPDAGNFTTNGISLVNELKMGANGINASNKSYSIFPNPSNGQFTVLVTDKNEITITNAAGQMVYTTLANGKTMIDLSAQPKGVYFIKLAGESSVTFDKIVIR